MGTSICRDAQWHRSARNCGSLSPIRSPAASPTMTDSSESSSFLLGRLDTLLCFASSAITRSWLPRSDTSVKTTTTSDGLHAGKRRAHGARHVHGIGVRARPPVRQCVRSSARAGGWAGNMRQPVAAWYSGHALLLRLFLKINWALSGAKFKGPLPAAEGSPGHALVEVTPAATAIDPAFVLSGVNVKFSRAHGTNSGFEDPADDPEVLPTTPTLVSSPPAPFKLGIRTGLIDPALFWPIRARVISFKLAEHPTLRRDPSLRTIWSIALGGRTTRMWSLFKTDGVTSPARTPSSSICGHCNIIQAPGSICDACTTARRRILRRLWPRRSSIEPTSRTGFAATVRSCDGTVT